jgi:DNA segregation ATPase FtsK/SpoIIIE-like protein
MSNPSKKPKKRRRAKAKADALLDMPRLTHQKVDTAFVFGQLEKIKKQMDAVDSQLDFLFASVLYEEAVEYVQARETVTYSEIQEKFHIGYGRTSYLLEWLTKAGWIKKMPAREEHSQEFKVINRGPVHSRYF